MAVKTGVRLLNQPFVKAFLAYIPDLSPATKSTALRSRSKAKATRHTPSSALNRSSFIFACLEPSSVSALPPSVWRKKGCRAHFWFRYGRIYWCKEHNNASFFGSSYSALQSFFYCTRVFINDHQIRLGWAFRHTVIGFPFF